MGFDPVIALRMPPEMRERIDAWAADQGGLPSRAEAIRRLVEQALATGKAKTRKP